MAVLLAVCSCHGDAPANVADADPGAPGDGDAAPGSPDAAVLPCGPWRYVRTVNLDTSPAGAAIPDDVSDYPLALQLDARSFDFTQANPDGSDIRFVKTDGTLLPHSIERWDAQAKEAAIWVKVDRIAGHSPAQSILMRWGNPAAEDASDAHAVFATAEGFVGVWHLGEPGSTTAGGYKDATAHAADATGVALDASASVAGRIGKAVALAHSRRQWIRLDGSEANHLFDIYNKMTYSIWTYARSHTVEYQCAFSKGETGFRMHYYGDSVWDDNQGKHIVESCVEIVGGDDLCPLKGGELTPWKGTDVAPGQWWHWVVVNDYPKISFYLNGALEVSIQSSDSWTSGAGKPVGIGNNTNWPDGARSWDGYLDEARVMNVAKDASWVKLDYESQREGQKLVSFGATETCL